MLASIAGVLGQEGISIESVIQKGRGVAQDDTVSVVIMTHEAQERHVQQALQAIQAIPEVQGETMRIRVEED